jgi:hypothetical protein
VPNRCTCVAARVHCCTPTGLHTDTGSIACCSATPRYLSASEEQLLEWQKQGKLVLSTAALGSTYAVTWQQLKAIQVSKMNLAPALLPFAVHRTCQAALHRMLHGVLGSCHTCKNPACVLQLLIES